jgi:hypothetical protein
MGAASFLVDDSLDPAVRAVIAIRPHPVFGLLLMLARGRHPQNPAAGMRRRTDGGATGWT